MKSTKENKAAQINKANNGMEEFLAKRKLQTETIEVERAERKVRARSGVKKLGKENFILLQILNAGAEGITFEQLVKVGAERVDPTTGLTEWESPTTNEPVFSNVSEITINHNWNVQSTAVQRGELKLRDPQALPEYKNSKRAIVGDIYFEVVDTKKISDSNKRKNNNNITLMFGAEILKDYLIAKGAKEEDFS